MGSWPACGPEVMCFSFTGRGGGPECLRGNGGATANSLGGWKGKGGQKGTVLSAVPEGSGRTRATWGRGRRTGAGIPDLLLPGCAPLDKLLNLSESLFPTL